jgi:hypothetical protein
MDFLGGFYHGNNLGASLPKVFGFIILEFQDEEDS